MKCDFCCLETDDLTSFPTRGFAYRYERIAIISPPTIWLACPFCTYCIEKEEKEVFLEHCITSQCINQRFELSSSNIKFVRGVLEPLHKAFLGSLGAPISN